MSSLTRHLDHYDTRCKMEWGGLLDKHTRDRHGPPMRLSGGDTDLLIEFEPRDVALTVHILEPEEPHLPQSHRLHHLRTRTTLSPEGGGGTDRKSQALCAHLIKQLFSCGVWLNGKLQLGIHGGHTDIDLKPPPKKKQGSLSQAEHSGQPLGDCPRRPPCRPRTPGVCYWAVYDREENVWNGSPPTPPPPHLPQLSEQLYVHKGGSSTSDIPPPRGDM